jgi:hypothetical protein
MGTRGSFPRNSVKLIIDLQLVPRSKKRVSIHSFPHTSSWRIALLVKHRDNFSFHLSESYYSTKRGLRILWVWLFLEELCFCLVDVPFKAGGSYSYRLLLNVLVRKRNTRVRGVRIQYSVKAPGFDLTCYEPYGRL